MKYLMLGGPLHGTTRDIPNCASWAYMPPAPFVTEGASEACDAAPIPVYRRFRLVYRMTHRVESEHRIVFANCNTHTEAAALLDRWHMEQGLLPCILAGRAE